MGLRRGNGVGAPAARNVGAEGSEDVRTRQHEAVARLGLLALRAADLGALMQEAARETASTLGVEFASVLEALPDGGLFLRAGVGWREGFVGRVTLPPGRASQAGFTLIAGDSVVVDDVATEERFELAPPLRDHEVGSGASVVVHGDERAFGVLSAHSTRTQAFTVEDVHFLQSVANVLAAAIERARVEDELRRRERQLVEAQQIARLGSWEWDAERDLVTWSDELYRIYGLERGTPLTYQAFLDRVHPDDRASARATIDAAYRDGSRFDFEHRIVRPDGSVRVIHSRGEAIRDGGGVSLRGTGQDITERKELEAREAERDRLQQMLDVLPVGVAVVDTAGKTILRNRATYEIFSELRSSSLEGALAAYEIFRPDGSRYALADLPLARSLRGEMVRGQQMVLRGTPRGADVVVLVNSAPLRAPDGTIVAAMSAFQDITDLAELERQRTEFFAMASHEIRQPVTAIKGMIQLARRGQPPPQISGQLARLEAQVERITALVNDLLDASRLVLGARAMTWGRIDLAQMLRECAARARGLAEVHRFELQLPEGPLWVSGAADELRIAVDNLLSNAVKYSPGRQVVRLELSLSAEAARPMAVVRVRDRGIGVPVDDGERVFEPFYRAKPAQDFGGTGLGLYICRQIARQHGGRVWLEESSPDGSTFALALPIERRAAPRG